jgi:hypothetical protein
LQDKTTAKYRLQGPRTGLIFITGLEFRIDRADFQELDNESGLNPT